jgi:3-oxoacyl-[acyl-carrier-protein] synthase-3
MNAVILAHSARVIAENETYVEAGAAAALDCLHAAKIPTSRVGALINVGVYRDSNIVEPAISALIQKRAGIGLEYATGDVPSFSFDLTNSECGLLNAVAVVDSIFAVDAVDYVMITAGDTHPSGASRLDAEFPYSRTGAAVLLGRSTSGGFGRVHVRASAEPVEAVGYLRLDRMAATGRSVITVHRSRASVSPAIAALTACVAAENVDVADLVVISSVSTRNFCRAIAKSVGLPDSAVVSVPDGIGDPHSAALVFAYDNAVSSGVLVGDRPALWLAAGGSVAACARYDYSCQIMP